MPRRPLVRRTATCVAAALLLGACADGGRGDLELVGATEADVVAGPPPAGIDDEVLLDVGASDRPCPGTPNQDNGCIVLGVVTDLTGPGAAIAPAVLDGNRRFWDRVNRDGGVGGRFDVLLADGHVRDAGGDPERHAAELADLEPEVLALAQSYGTVATRAIADELEAADLLAVTPSGWSGFETVPHVLTTGSSRCIDGANGLDWLLANLGTAVGPEGEQVVLPGEVTSVAVVQVTGPDADDTVVGVGAAAARADVPVATIVTDPVLDGTSLDDVVAQLVSLAPDVVWVAGGPVELALLVAGAHANGFDGLFMGSQSTLSPALLASDAAAIVPTRYLWVGPHGSLDAPTAAHEALRADLGPVAPTSDGVTAGWMSSYPLLAVLEAAVAAGDLTRAGLAAVLQDTTVAFEGAVPARRYGADPNLAAMRSSVVGKATAATPLAGEVVAERFVGPTAARLDVARPCSDSR